MRFPFLTLLGLVSLLTSGRAEPPAPAGGTIESAAAPSAALGHEIRYQIYLPPGYRADGTVRYPAVYLLHGRGDKPGAWLPIKAELDRLISEGRIPAAIAVMPDAPSSQRAGYYIDSQFRGTEKLPAGEAVESAFTRDLINHIDATYLTGSDRTDRVVAGYSMGGYGAIRYALAHPDLFGAAIVLSPAVYVPLPPADSSTREFGAFGKGPARFDDAVYTALNYPALIPGFTARKLPLVMFIAVGDDEHAIENPGEAAHDLDYEAHTLYNRLRRVPGIDAQLRVVNGGHNWDTWRPTFVEGIQYVFSRRQARR